MQTPKCQTLHCPAVLSGKLKAKPIILKSHKLSEFRSHSGIDFCSHPCTVFYFQCIVRVHCKAEARIRLNGSLWRHLLRHPGWARLLMTHCQPDGDIVLAHWWLMAIWISWQWCCHGARVSSIGIASKYSTLCYILMLSTVCLHINVTKGITR